MGRDDIIITYKDVKWISGSSMEIPQAGLCYYGKEFSVQESVTDDLLARGLVELVDDEIIEEDLY